MVNLIEDLDNRNVVMKNNRSIEVLENVKRILTLGNTDFVTVQMTADYFEVDKHTIEVLILRNKEELESNGLKLYKRKEIRNIFLNSHLVSLETTNRGIYLISKRVLLNIGMLLRDSEVAKELRKRLLDVIFDTQEGKGNINTIVEEINEEERLSMELGKAIVKGDINKMLEINTRLFELKNKRIIELEGEIEHLTPLAESFNIFLNTEGLTDISTFAKDLGIKGLGRNKMYKYLRDIGMLMSSNKPYQVHIDNRLFILRPCGSHMVNGEVIQDYKTFLTTKGVNKLIKILKDNHRI